MTDADCLCTDPEDPHPLCPIRGHGCDHETHWGTCVGCGAVFDGDEFVAPAGTPAWRGGWTASPDTAYPGMLNTSPPGGTRGKDTHMDAYQATPTVTTTAEYGVRRSSGRTDWLQRQEGGRVWIDPKDGTGPVLLADGEKYHDDAARRALARMAKVTEKVAEDAGLPFTDADRPVLVVRRVVTLTEEPTTIATSLASEPVDPSDGFDF